MTNTIQNSIAQLIDNKEYPAFLNAILEVIVANGIDAALRKMERVHDLLIGQLEKLYEDNRIDASEVLVKGELQSLFGLGYADFNAIAKQCAKEALQRGANIKDLDIFLPYDK